MDSVYQDRHMAAGAAKQGLIRMAEDKSDRSSERDSIADTARRRQAQILDKPPRVLPLDRDEHAAEIVAFTSLLRNEVACAELTPVPLEYCPDLVPTLLRHPELWKRLSSLSAIVQCAQAKVPVRIRQLAILRTVWLCGAPYQWGEHLERTRQAGVSDEEIERIKAGSAVSGWSRFDKAVLSAVEELHTSSFVVDDTWTTLAEQFDENQMIELMVLIGQFTSVAFLLNSLRLRLEGNNRGFLAS